MQQNLYPLEDLTCEGVSTPGRHLSLELPGILDDELGYLVQIVSRKVIGLQENLRCHIRVHWNNDDTRAN